MGSLVKMSPKKYWESGSPDTYKSVFNSLRDFLDFQKSRNDPVHEWGLGSVLISFEHRRWILLGEYDLRIRNASQGDLQKSARVPPKSHLRRYVADCRKFGEIAGITYLAESG